MKRETNPQTWGGSSRMNEINWPHNGDTLKWDITPSELQQLKATSPKLKLQIMASHSSPPSPSTAAQQSVGYVLLDTRDLERGVNQQWFKVHGMLGAEILLSAKLNHVLATTSSVMPGNVAGVVNLSSITSEAATNTFHKSNLIPESHLASTESAISVLRLAGQGDEESTNAANDQVIAGPRFTLSVSLEGFQNLSLLCEKHLVDFVADKGPSTPPPTYWLSYTLFNDTFQTEEFVATSMGPKKVKDSIRVQCTSASAMASKIYESFPLRVYLVTADKVLGYAQIPAPMPTIPVTSGSINLASFPLTISGWYPIIHPSSIASSSSSSTSSSSSSSSTPPFSSLPLDHTLSSHESGIKVTVNVVVDPPKEKDFPSANNSQAKVSDDDAYDNDDFEDEDAGNDAGTGEGTGGDSRGRKGVHFSDAQGSGSGGGSLSPSRSGKEGDTSGEDNDDDDDIRGGREAGQRKKHGKRRSKGADDSEGELESEGEGALADQQMRHFRMSVDVRSIAGLKRPTHVAVHFAYPHLGVSSPVRTHPQWVMQGTEAKIDGATASYECCLSRERLKETLKQYSLKISTLSRSPQGSSPMGDVNVDLHSVFLTTPHSYRCPLTGRGFKSMNEYSKHRQTLCALRAAGRVAAAPPPLPVIIRAVDTYLHLLPPAQGAGSGGKVGAVGSTERIRVCVIIEDLGMVGGELALSVKPGYKMHGGGVYELGHDIEHLNVDGGLTDSLNQPLSHPDPLDRDDLTPTERAHLQALRVDWEGWRRAAEAQWTEALRERERILRKKLEDDAARTLAQTLAHRADDLKRAHEEAGRLEIRLRGAIDQVERQKQAWTVKEEQVQMRLAQKTAELQLLQRRVRDEAKVRVEAETRRADALQAQVKQLTADLERADKRLQDCEKDFDAYRAHTRATPESMLREEVAKLRAQLGESRAETERERRLRSDAELEKEHFRAQMHRLAGALKRERERSSAMARQELEQLRLEFLAREERYVLDGDREELRNIRHELAALRSMSLATPSTGSNTSTQPLPPSSSSSLPPPPPPTSSSSSSSSKAFIASPSDSQDDRKSKASALLKHVLGTGLYSPTDEVVSLMIDSLASQAGGGSGSGVDVNTEGEMIH